MGRPLAGNSQFVRRWVAKQFVYKTRYQILPWIWVFAGPTVSLNLEILIPEDIVATLRASGILDDTHDAEDDI
ncbi:hypothetical protein PAPYR_6411 [Paratrimastix pyriformis]|uniref:Uncharacterized protein n=1 Tax=Paratrimastix pyriformis TaxID=342808 RepID=A0ABQ8UMM8_9EUKA|nr:hypothetical protein PAPYR_6411 [Paratrimastix pyriformis]